MRKNSIFEILLCAAIIAVAAGFMVFMRMRTGIGSVTSYALTARLTRVDGLNIGTDVRLGGVKIGTVTGLSLEPGTFLADVRMDIRSDIGIPADSGVGISTGVMSSPYLAIAPGHSPDMLAPGTTFKPR